MNKTKCECVLCERELSSNSKCCPICWPKVYVPCTECLDLHGKVKRQYRDKDFFAYAGECPQCKGKQVVYKEPSRHAKKVSRRQSRG